MCNDRWFGYCTRHWQRPSFSFVAKEVLSHHWFRTTEGKHKIPLSQVCVLDDIGPIVSRERIKGRYWSNNFLRRRAETILWQIVFLSKAHPVSWENLKLVHLEITWFHPSRSLVRYESFHLGTSEWLLFPAARNKCRGWAKLYNYYEGQPNKKKTLNIFYFLSWTIWCSNPWLIPRYEAI